MPTTKIMVIRHAEKPNGEPGAMPDGSSNPEALTATGWRRAEALVGLFDPIDGRFKNRALAKPRRLFASDPSDADKSLRPLQTITPLARALGEDIDKTFAKGQEEALVAKAKAIGDVVLVGWQHEKIPEIAGHILGVDASFPAHWPGHRFDLVWVFDRQPGADAWSMTQVPQMLLPGDRPDPIPSDE